MHFRGHSALPPLLLCDETGVVASQSRRARPKQTVVSYVTTQVQVNTKDAFVTSMTNAMTDDLVVAFVKAQGSMHVRMDLDLLSRNRDDRSAAVLKIFSVDAQMLVSDLLWSAVDCVVVRDDYLKADGCRDGGSTNKLFYRFALSLKQFVAGGFVPIEHVREVFEAAYDLFVGNEKELGPGFSNIQTFSGIPFFHLKPFSLE